MKAACALRWAAATALVVMASVSGTAGAGEMTIEPAGEVSLASNGKVTFGSGLADIECEVTLEGTLTEEVVPLTDGEQFGSVTEVQIDRESCSGGSVTAVLELPWSLAVDSSLSDEEAPEYFTGVSFRSEASAIALEVFGFRCLYGGEAGMLLGLVRERNGAYDVEAFDASEGSIPLVSGGGLCPSTITWSGEFDIEPAQTVVADKFFSVDPGGRASGAVTLTTPQGATTCRLSLRVSFRERIAQDMDGFLGSLDGFAAECEPLGSDAVTLEFPSVMGDTMFADALLRDRGLGITGALGEAPFFETLVSIGEDYDCRFTGDVGALIGRSTLTLLGETQTLERDLNEGAGDECNTIRIGGSLAMESEQTFDEV